MIEKFENRTLSGKVHITCKFEDGTVRIWDTRKEKVIKHIIEIVNEYESEGYVLTLRQLHYQLVKSNWIVNHDSAYKKLGGILDDCKYAGIIDWGNIEDRGRKPYLPYWVYGVEDALNDTVNQYRLDRQKGQDIHVELWTEKDALSAILQRSTEKYHIQLVVNKGYTSSSAIYNAYQRCVSNMKQGKKVVILYFGDHDPSGLDMIRDIRERLQLMLREGAHYDAIFGNEYAIEHIFAVKPIGLTMDQIKEHNLPPNPTKLTDTRAKKYIRKFGKVCWEVDALNPKTLTSIIETNIQELIDLDLYKEMLKEEQEGHLELIESKFERYPELRYNTDVWNDIGNEIGWCSLTAALWYFRFHASPSAPTITEQNTVDKFLREHPEYRCLDMIGKFDEWLLNQGATTTERPKGLNLDELERKLDEVLDKETLESLKQWLKEKRGHLTKQDLEGLHEDYIKSRQGANTTEKRTIGLLQALYTVDGWLNSDDVWVTDMKGKKIKGLVACEPGALLKSFLKTMSLYNKVAKSEGEEWTRERVQKAFKELGFELPETEDQLKAFNEKFKDYPHKLTEKEIDPLDILNSVREQGQHKGKDDKGYEFCKCKQPARGNGPCCDKCGKVINRA